MRGAASLAVSISTGDRLRDTSEAHTVDFYRRCPMLISRASAFGGIAPSLRFISLEILATGVSLLECPLRSRTFS